LGEGCDGLEGAAATLLLALLPPLDLLALYKLLRRAFMSSCWLVEETPRPPLPTLPPAGLLDAGTGAAFGVATTGVVIETGAPTFDSSSDSPEDESPPSNNNDSILPLIMV
jgi:hypothetical protein